MGWQIIKDGASVDVSTGTGTTDATTAVIGRSGQRVDNLSKFLVDRWEAGDELVRSLVAKVDKDGNLVSGSVSGASAAVAEKDAKINELEAQLNELRGQLSTARSTPAASAENAADQTVLGQNPQRLGTPGSDETAGTDADQTQPGAVAGQKAVDEMKREELEAELGEERLAAVEGSGANGNVLVDDLRAAVEKARAGESEGPKAISDMNKDELEAELGDDVPTEGSGADGNVVVEDLRSAVAAKREAAEGGGSAS